MSKQILKSIFLFTVISFTERGINYLITLALAQYLPPEELGKLAYVLTVQAYIYPLILVYSSGAILLHYSTEKDDLNYFYNSAVINFSAFSIVILVTLVTGLIIQLSFLSILMALLLISLLESLRLNYLAYNQAFLNFKRYAVTAIFFVVMNLLITFLFLYVFKPVYEYRVYAILISNSLVFVLMLVYLRKSLRFSINKAFIRNVLAYGLPLLPHAFGLLAIESLNRYFLDGFGNKHELGLYSFAFSLAAPLGILNTAFITAWTPHLYRLFQQHSANSKKRIMQVHVLYILFIFAAGLMISLFSKNILQLFSVKYIDAAGYLMVIPFYFCIQAVYMIFSTTLFYFRKNKYFIYLSVVNILASFLINYILFSRYGISATAYCSVLSLAIFTIIVVILSQRTYRLPWLEIFTLKDKN